MKIFVFSLFSVLALLVCSCSVVKNNSDPKPYKQQLPKVENRGYDHTTSDIADWQLLWEENFESNLDDWAIWNGGAFNNELQLYQKENLHIKDGFFFVESKRETGTGTTNPINAEEKTFGFTSGRIETKTEYGPKEHGGTLRISARIKLPEGEGLWPAFWTYADPWPSQGEIDILEYRGSEPYVYESTFHYGTENDGLLTNGGELVYEHRNATKLSEEFHVYELIWGQNTFTMLFDGKITRTYTLEDSEYIDDFYDKTHRVILNLAVGGGFFQNLDESQIPDTSYLIVDWVKVFKEAE